MNFKNNNWFLVLLVTGLLSLAGCKSDSMIVSDGGAVGGDLATADSDGDGVLNGEDNCPLVSNSNQSDIDGDGLGDVCDSDIDGDGTDNSVDICPTDPNNAPGCEDNADTDGDGIRDVDDNCPAVSNPGQEDSDGDGIGDACDSNTDSDGDGVQDEVDNCPNDANPGQDDSDGDGIGNACDPVPDSDPNTAYACGTATGAEYKPLLAPAANAIGDTSFLCLNGCVENPENVVDSNVLNSASIQVPVGLGTQVSLSVTDTLNSYPAVNRLGVAIGDADQLLNVTLLGNITVQTALDGEVRETFDSLELADLDLLGAINDEAVGFLVFDTTAEFDQVTVSVGGINVLTQVNVLAICAAPPVN